VIASAHKNNVAREKINIVIAASTNVQLRRSTTPFSCGVRTEDIWRLKKNRDPFHKLDNHFWISSNPRNRQIAQPGNPAGYNDVIENQFNQNAVQNPRTQNVGNQNGLIGVQGNGNLVATRADGNAAGQNGNQIRCYNCRGVGIQLQAEEYDLIAAAADLDEIEEVNANCILMANLQQASTLGTQTDSAPIYDTDGSAKVHENCDNNEIFNMFTQEEQYTELLEPIPESHQVPQNDNDVISEDTGMEQGGETEEQHPANFEETRALYESLYQNLATEVEKVNSVNRKLKETNANMTTELARYKNQERCFEIKETLQLAQESRDKMKQMNKEIKPANYTKINHLSGVFIPQKALSREELYFSNNSKMTNVSKSFLIPNEDLSDDTTPSVACKFLNEASSAHQELHKIVREENFPIFNQVDARLQNFKIQFLKEAAKFVGDFKSLAKEADDSLAKHKTLEVEIKRLLKAVVSQDIMIIVLNESVVDTSDLQTELERMKECFENSIIKKETEYAKLGIKSLFKKVSDQKDNTQDTSANTKFAKQPIVENLPKIGKTNALSKPVTSNNISTPQEPKSMNNDKKFMGTVRFGNDHVAAILGFGDLQWGNILITRVYFVEGLGHNLFSVGQFCDSDLEVTFRRNASFVRNLEGVDLLKGDRTPFPSCEQGKSKRASHPPKPVPNSRQRLHLLHMDLCGPIRIASINGKRCVLVIVDDYSRYTWSPVIIIRTDNGTKFKNQVLKEYFDTVGISHQMSSVRTPQQNGVVERRNWTLVEAARTMLIFSRASLFLWAEAIATTCFTQNRSIIHHRFNKTPYELINRRKPYISFLHVFGALCYPKNDRKDIRKLGAKGDIGFFIGYSVDSCAYRVYNRRTKKIIETMNVSFDELSAIAFEQRSSKPRLNIMTSGHISSGLDLTYAPSTITT
nr:integrase, catalytic region, zinc finger, CCHC-type, peptidase aspartic, catalytic [Tanacetum cinerariifolium]